MADEFSRATASTAKATPAGVAILLLVAGLGMTLQGFALPPDHSWGRWLGLAVLAAGAALYAGSKVRSR